MKSDGEKLLGFFIVFILPSLWLQGNCFGEGKDKGKGECKGKYRITPHFSHMLTLDLVCVYDMK